MEWQTIMGISAVVAAFTAVGTLLYAVLSGRKLIEKVATQADLLRRRVYGELYDEARVEDLHFFLPARRNHEVKGFKQKDEEDTILGKYIAIPVGMEVELHLEWQMGESQTLRGYSLLFGGDRSSKSEILGVEVPLIKTRFQEFPREEYVDYVGRFQCEYAHQRRMPKGVYFNSSPRVRGVAEGSYPLYVSVAVDEAPQMFEGTLTVDCVKEPNDWAKQHWC